MVKVTGDYFELYQREDPTLPGRPVTTHVTPFRVNDDIPLDAEVEAAVRQLRLNKAGRHTQVRAEHFKKCL